MRPAHAALVLIALLASCASADVDGDDRDALFLDARVRKVFEGEPDHDGTYVEAGWREASGDTAGVDYRISTVSVAFGTDSPVGTSGWAGFASGLAWQRSDFDSELQDLDRDDAYGPVVIVQGGWLATTWLEPCARADLGLYFPDFSTALGVEVGARFHVVEHAALFAGWRYTYFHLSDFDDFTSVDDAELDASGLALGLELAF